MKHGLSSSSAALAALLLVAGVAGAQDGPPPAAVSVARVTEGRLAATTRATGTVVSRNDARLSAEVAGRLDWVAEPGARVAKGAPVARVDARELGIQLRQDEAQVSRLAANVELLDTQLARLEALPDGIASRSQIDEAGARLSMARHELEQARAARDRTKHLVDRAVIRAPFPGHVVERIHQLGEFVAAGAEILRLTDTGYVEVVARAPVAEAEHLTVGAPVTVHGASGQAASRIRAIIPVGDERSRMLEVRVAMQGEGWPIGSAVRVELPVAAATAAASAFVVPRDAVIVRSDGAHVFRVGQDGTAERVPVRVGNGDGKRVEVSGSLSAADRVVVRGGERLRAGQAVTVAGNADAGPSATARRERAGRTTTG